MWKQAFLIYLITKIGLEVKTNTIKAPLATRKLWSLFFKISKNLYFNHFKNKFTFFWKAKAIISRRSEKNIIRRILKISNNF